MIVFSLLINGVTLHSFMFFMEVKKSEECLLLKSIASLGLIQITETASDRVPFMYTYLRQKSILCNADFRKNVI